MKAEELQQKIDQGADMLLLDVREKDEVEAHPASMPGVMHMPMGKVFTEAAAGNLPKDQKIITICKSGGRCGIVAHELAAKGFDIEPLEGGLKDWEEVTE